VMWEFLCGFGCESFCMGLVVRISVWVWVRGISVCCGCGDFCFEFSSENFCVTVTSSFLSEDEMQGYDIRVMTCILCQSLI
jgi:hypothetical protein